MRRVAVTNAVQVVLLAGPTALAFFAGGVFDAPRTVAAVSACALLALCAIALPGAPAPSAGPGKLAVGSLAGLTAWTALSSGWAPLDGPAHDDLGRLVLYAATFATATIAWRSRRELRRIEPALAAGALLVVGYGLSERLLPDMLDFDGSLSAGGRLEQPLTYWNAMGALAALGLVLAARIAGDGTRHPRLRCAAAAAAPALGAGVYLSYSRGALGALAAGLLLLVLLAPNAEQLRALALVGPAALAAGLVGGFLPAVSSLDGGLAERRLEGAAMLVALVALSVGAALLQRRHNLRRAHGASRLLELLRRRRAPIAAAALVCVIAATIIGAVGTGPAPTVEDAGSRRISSLQSNRYSYWEVALSSFADSPMRGEGTGSFRVAWTRERDVRENVQDAHSLYLETAAELGLVGLLLLAGFLGGTAECARRAMGRDPALAAGLCGGMTVWAVHAGLDWDWEMPALTLPALILAGALVARAEPLSAPATDSGGAPARARAQRPANAPAARG